MTRGWVGRRLRNGYFVTDLLGVTTLSSIDGSQRYSEVVSRPQAEDLSVVALSLSRR